MPTVRRRVRIGRWARRCLLLALLLLLAAGTGAPAALVRERPAAAADDGWNEAVVVVDTGSGGPKASCVRFREASITGLDLLRAGQMDPEVQGFSGNGAAVCKLCGVGCNPGNSCLTCQSPKYWQYFRAPSGTSAFSYSRGGAGSTRVVDGDVDGWTWSDGDEPPPYLSVASVCSDPGRTFVYTSSSSSAPSSTTTSAAPPPPPPADGQREAPAAGAGAPTPAPSPSERPRSPTGSRPAASTTVPPAGQVAAAPASPGSTTTALPVVGADPDPSVADDASDLGTDADGDAGDLAASRSQPGRNPTATDGEEGTSPAALALLVVVLAGLGAASFRFRRRNRETQPVP